jgi:hypothetical protein
MDTASTLSSWVRCVEGRVAPMVAPYNSCGALSVRSFGVFSSNSALERKGGAGNEEMPSRLSVEYSVGSGGEIPRAPPKIPPRIPPQTD